MIRIVKITNNNNHVSYAIERTIKRWLRKDVKVYLDLANASYNSFHWHEIDNRSNCIGGSYTRDNLSEVAAIFKKLSVPLFTAEPVAASELEKVIYDI